MSRYYVVFGSISKYVFMFWIVKNLDLILQITQFSKENVLLKAKSESEGRWVMFDPLQPHGLLQARILEWVAFHFSRGSSQPRDGTQVSCIAGWFFTAESQEKPLLRAKVRFNLHSPYCRSLTAFFYNLE